MQLHLLPVRSGSDCHHRFVWHLESNQGSQVLLPQQPSCCVTRGEYVAFLRRDSALLWKFGCELTALDLDPVLDSNQRISNAWADVASSYTMGIFFHPSEKGTLYISVCFTYVRQVAIHKFTSAGYSGVHEINLREIGALSHLSFGDVPGFNIDGANASCRAISPVNSSGDFAVAEWRTFSSGKPLHQGIHVPGTTFIELRFNAETGNFSFKEKSLPSGNWDDTRALDLGNGLLLPSWNDQMVFAVRVEQHRQLPGGAGSVEKLCWKPALVVLPLCFPITSKAHVTIHGLHPAGNQNPEAARTCSPRLVAVEAHLADNRLDLSPATSLELETEENQRYPLKAQSHEWDASTQTLKSLYANSDFILDLPSFLECPGYSSWNLDPHHIFQDDDFIILFHRHGYTAWDFRAEPART